MERLRADLVDAMEPLEDLWQKLVADGYRLSPVRILDILVWTESEQAGSYRA